MTSMTSTDTSRAAGKPDSGRAGVGHGLRSMTGQGHARNESRWGTITVEIRTVNHRGLKCSVRLSETLGAHESLIEAIAREKIHRGSVQIHVTWRPPADTPPQQINETVLSQYYAQCVAALRKAGDDQGTVDITNLIALPGVLMGASSDSQARGADSNEPLWDQVRIALHDAIDNLNQLRDAEGTNMAASLQGDCQLIGEHLTRIEQWAPDAVERYRERIESKVRKLLQQHDVDVETVDLLREVQIYADRSDISEETTRLGSHLQLFADVMSGEHAANKNTFEGADTQKESRDASREAREPTGRKLDFIIQEMFRETNTIGSKANHAGISGQVVEIKCAIERMRELVQNLE